MGESDFKVSIRNFQIIRDATMVFEPGLNVIVGQSHNGKSSSMRSIEALLYNVSNDTFISAGTTKAAVGVEYQGNEVIWMRDSKKASSVSYRINKEIHTKLGRGQSEIVADLLGMKEIELESSKLRLNFHKQMSYPFMLDKTPSQLFKFIVQSAEEDNLMDVIDTMKKDLSANIVNVKAYEQSRETLKVSINREVKQYRIKEKGTESCGVVLELDAKVKLFDLLKDTIQSIEIKTAGITQLSKRLNVFTCYTPEEDTFNQVGELLNDYALLKKTIEDLQKLNALKKSYQDRYNLLKKELVTLSMLEQVDLSSLEDQTRGYNEALTIKESILKTVRALGTVKGRKAFNDTRLHLLEPIKEITEIESIQEKRDQAISLSNDLEASLLKEKALEQLKMGQEIISQKLQKVQAELKEYKVCPYCNSDLSLS